jgi:hypothetical protein
VTPSLPWVPPGENPETYDIDRVHTLMKSAAYFPIFNIHNPQLPNQTNYLIPGVPLFIRSIDVNEQLHRFEIQAKYTDQGLGAANRVGEAVATVHIQWTPIPDFYAPSPGVQPCPWALNPFIEQRFVTLNGHLDFQDKEQSGIRAFGVGRTYPVVEGGQNRLRIGAAIEVLEGVGKFKGLQGAMCINGCIEPPEGLALNLFIRLIDPDGRLKAWPGSSPIAPIQPITDPDPDAVFMMFLGEVDPSQGVHLIPSPDGKGIIGSRVHELLRLVSFRFDMSSAADLRTTTEEGPVVGRVDAQLYFNMFDPNQVIPIQTTNEVFTFFDSKGRTIGAILSNMVEGRAFRTQIAGFAMSIFRFVGFGPVLGGTGEFSGAEGMLTMNSCVSVFPRTLSNLYIFRFYDPQRKLRAAWGDYVR